MPINYNTPTQVPGLLQPNANIEHLSIIAERTPTIYDQAPINTIWTWPEAGTTWISQNKTKGENIWVQLSTVDTGDDITISGNFTSTAGNLNLTSGNATVGGDLFVLGESTFTQEAVFDAAINFNNVTTSPTPIMEYNETTTFFQVNSSGGYVIGNIAGAAGATAYLANVAGVTTTVADAVPVLVSASTGQLGTVSSSARFKDNIKDLKNYTPVVELLRPVSFTYKSNNASSIGLIAEEVEQLMPELVVYKNEIPETVKYQDLPILLLQYIQKLNKRIEDLEATIKR